MMELHPLFHHYQRNVTGRDFVVGDIHGHFSTLDRLLERVAFDHHRDRLFSLGDLIDRGPESERFTHYVKQPWFHAIRGNHEQMMIDGACWAGDFENWRRNGGHWATDYMSPDAIDAMRKVANRLPFGIEIETPAGLVGLIHSYLSFPTWAEFRAAVLATPMKRAEPLQHAETPMSSPYFHSDDAPWASRAVWSRSAALAIIRENLFSATVLAEMQVPDLHALVTGHAPAVVVRRLHAANIYLIDTGAGHAKEGAALTVLDLQTFEVASEPTWEGATA
jgi:serine/threonine protein phosphatase 1